MAFDAGGALYIAELQGHRVRKMDAQQRILVVAGSGVQGYAGDGGPATAAQLDSPAAIALDGTGTLYISDSHNHRVRRVDAATGVITTVAGTGVAGSGGDNGPATAATLDLPVGLALDASGDLWIADARAHRIRNVDARTGVIDTVAGTGSEGDGGDGGPAVQAMLDTPTSLAVDADGNVYVADEHNHRIRRIDAISGVITAVVGGSATAGAQDEEGRGVSLRLPRGLSLDASGMLFVADMGAQKVLRLDPSTGVMQSVAGSGIEGFSGEMGAPLSATLDGPRGAIVSPAGLLTIADTENGRVRQVTGAGLETIAGTGASGVAAAAPLSATTVAMSGPQALPYGSGTVTAHLTASGSATGTVALVEGGAVLASAPVIGNGANLSTAAIAAGAHTVAVLYSGDSTHAASVSVTEMLTVSPAALSVTVNPVNTVYGAVIPVLTGSVSGLLAQDVSRLTIAYTTGATPTSVVGAYPITVLASGTAAGNYALQVVPGLLTVAKAGSATTISQVSVASGTTTLAVNVGVQSRTTGQPTGTVTLLDGDTPIAGAALGGDGMVVLASGSLASGAHMLTVFYPGDSSFLPSTSAATAVNLGGGGSPPPPKGDFALTCTAACSQPLAAGSPANFALSAHWTGAMLSSPVALSVSGLPAYATAAFNPPYLPPGGAVSGFTLTVTVSAQAAMVRGPTREDVGSALGAIYFGLPVILMGRGKKWRLPCRSVARAAFVSIALLCLAGCGDRVTATTQTAGPASKSVPLTVTGTITDPDGVTRQHTTVVTLIVQSTS